MHNRKFKIAAVSSAAVFALLCCCVFIRASDAVTQSIAALLGSIILFYMGGNVGEHFAVARRTGKE